MSNYSNPSYDPTANIQPMVFSGQTVPSYAAAPVYGHPDASYGHPAAPPAMYAQPPAYAGPGAAYAVQPAAGYVPQQQQPPPPSPYGQPMPQYSGAYPTPPEPGYAADMKPQASSFPATGALPPTNNATAGGGDRWAQSGKWNDVWASVLFAAHMVFVIWAAAANSSALKSQGSLGDSNLSGWSPVLGVMTVLAVIWSIVWVKLMEKHASKMIWVTNIGSIVILVLLGVASIAFKSGGGAVIAFICAALNALWLYLVRHRIPFASVTLANAAPIPLKWPATIFTAIATIALLIVYIAVWAYAYSVSYLNKQGGTQLFLVLSLYWTSQVATNFVHTVVSGVVATWYFCGDAAMPSNPTARSIKRSLTTSFGSICFGSLIVAIIKTIRYLVRSARRENALACVFDCVLGILDNLVEFFNTYAYTQIAIYGKPFRQAAKDTWNLFKSNGWTAVINNDLIDAVLGLACLISGAVCAIIGGVWYHNAFDGGAAGVVAFICFLIGFAVMNLFTSVIYSACITLFVCYAEDPAALSRVNPTLYAEFGKAVREFSV